MGALVVLLAAASAIGFAIARRALRSAQARRRTMLAAVAARPGLQASRACAGLRRRVWARSSEEIVSALDAMAPLAAALGGARR